MNYYHRVETKCNESGITFYGTVRKQTVFITLYESALFVLPRARMTLIFLCGKFVGGS